MRESTVDWLVYELKEAQEENIKLKQELDTLKGGIADVLLQKEWKDRDGNNLTGGQVKDQKLKKIAGYVFNKKVVPFMGLFNEIEEDWSQLKIGFTQ